YMQLRIKRSEPSQEFEIPVLFQTGMQSADHVHFGDSKGKRIRHGLNNFVNCIFECVRVTLFGGKCAELAGLNSDVRVVDVPVVDIGRVIAVLSLAYYVGDDSQSVEIVCTVKGQSVRF